MPFKLNLLKKKSSWQALEHDAVLLENACKNLW